MSHLRGNYFTFCNPEHTESPWSSETSTEIQTSRPLFPFGRTDSKKKRDPTLLRPPPSRFTRDRTEDRRGHGTDREILEVGLRFYPRLGGGGAIKKTGRDGGP